jgi:Tfp pilus assembly protein PilV
VIKRIITLKQRGDTIVEVLIALAVASSVLGITYATMNRNLIITRAAQERTEAAKLAQGQLEILKSKSDKTAPSGDKFCYNIAGTAVTTGFDSSTPTADITSDLLNTTGYPAACIRSFYHIVIVKTSTRNYKVYVRWDRFSSGARDEVNMVYRTQN